ncbi:MAG: RDD family protein [Acidobacteria bacterium]|nr:RDD family protein [Acidobacteriota bacterium]
MAETIIEREPPLRAAQSGAVELASPAAPDVAAGEASAGAASRVAAALIDLTILAAIDAAVVYFTLQICGLSLADLRIVPAAPLLAFLLLLNTGYSVAFTTAAGQTIGKMTVGIRVVGTETGERVNFGYAVLRTAAYFVSALPAGLGFAPALVGADRRALHDRLAETRVVQLPASSSRLPAVGHARS